MACIVCLFHAEHFRTQIVGRRAQRALTLGQFSKSQDYPAGSRIVGIFGQMFCRNPLEYHPYAPSNLLVRDKNVNLLEPRHFFPSVLP